MALQNPESDQNYIHYLMKASEQLDKSLSEEKIRSLIDRLSVKNGADVYVYSASISKSVSILHFRSLKVLCCLPICCRAKKEAKREEKLLIKQMERDKREAEKEKKRLERERQKEELLSVSYLLIPVVLSSCSVMKFRSISGERVKAAARGVRKR